MTNREIKIVAAGFTYTEGPRWHNGELWFVDFYTKTVNRVDAEGTVHAMATVEGQPSGLGWLPDDTLIIVSMKDKKVLRLEDDGSLSLYDDIEPFCNGYANDMVVAPNGNAYIGHFGFDLMGGGDHELADVLLVRPNGQVEVVARELSFPNGMVITPDEKTLIENELFGNRISKFDIRADGALGPRQDFANYGWPGDEPDWQKRVANATIAPDGLTLDAEGAVWAADTSNARAVRIADGGAILDEVGVAPDGVFAVALGGADGRSLFLSLAPDFDETARSAVREAKVGVVKVDVPHAGTP